MRNGSMMVRTSGLSHPPLHSTPGNGRRSGAPPLPTALAMEELSPPPVPERAIRPDPDDVEPARRPGPGFRRGFQEPAQRPPAAPGRAVPLPVPQRAIRPDTEDVQPVGRPRYGRGRGSEDSAQGFPATPG